MNTSFFSPIRRIAAHWLYAQRSFLRWPLVTVDATGRVLDLESRPTPDRLAGVEFFAGILLPGMVDAHCHLELSYLCGAIPEGTGLAGFARAMGRVRGGFTAARRLRAIESAYARLWAEGVSGLGDICNGPETFAVKASGPVACMNFIEVFGPTLRSAEGAMPVFEAARRHGLRAGVTPHATYSLGAEAFRDAVQATPAEPLSIHLLEGPEEEALFRGEGPFAAWYRERGIALDLSDAASPACRVAAAVPRGRRVLAVHAAAATDADIERLQERFGADLWWVLCPRSNRYIGGLVPPVGTLRRMGANICIGTDSLASNRSLSMIGELKSLPDVPLAEALDWATASGARALGFEQLGEIVPGRRPGIVLLEGADLRHLSLTPQARTRRLV